MSEQHVPPSGQPLVRALLERLRRDEPGCASTLAHAPALLPWSAAFESGEATIDAEHRRLFELGNEALEASRSMDTQPRVFRSALNALLVHVTRHFLSEERILEQRGYAGLEAHKRAHRELLERARELELQSDAGRITIDELAEFLALDIVANHLLTSDTLFFPLMRERD